MNWLRSQPPSVVVYLSRFPIWLDLSGFDNGEGGAEDLSIGPLLTRSDTKDETLTSPETAQLIEATVSQITSFGHVVVLVYPIPAVGFDVGEAALQRSLYLGPEMGLSRPFTTLFDAYRRYAQSTYELFDSIEGERIVRHYPSSLFCQERPGGRCTTHSSIDIWYADDDHLSKEGADLLSNDLITILSPPSQSSKDFAKKANPIQ